MEFDSHFGDLLKVLGANTGALALSLTDVEYVLQISILGVSLVYAITKTAIAMRELKDKKKK